MSQYWTLLDKLPTELKEIIEKMVWDMEHKEKFALVMKDIPLKAAKTKFNILTQDHILLNDNYDSFMSFLKFKLPDKETIVDILSHCKCCERHQKNKPSHINDWKLNFMPKESEENTCKCICRHYSRMICSSVLM
jgi:hypothetical protein